MTQKKNNKESEIISMIDRAISELVYEKTKMIKAYNYYHGKRDPDQFRHLEENYGIGTPTSVEFVPLVRKHIDVLIGEYLSTPVMPKISCKDSMTLSNIHREKQLKIHEEVAKELNSHLRNTIYNTLKEQQNVSDAEVEYRLNSLREWVDKNFISEYEVAAQNIVDYSMQARNIDFQNKRKILLTDLLIAGICYYQVKPSSGNTNINLRVLNPLNTFIDRNPDSPYLKDSARSVIREYLTKDQILSKYGHLLDEEDIDSLDSLADFGTSDVNYVRSYNSTITDNTSMSDGILGGYEITPMFPQERSTSKYFRLFPTYEVEWLKAEKEDGEYVLNRYEGIRIGTHIYIPIGKSENVTRSSDNPKECSLSVNGILYSDRNGEPFSLVAATSNLQDKYDVLCFYRDNIISESGTVGDWIDIAHVPKFLGTQLAERLMKWKAYKKQGMALYDSSQEGQQLNTSFNGFDDTVKLQAIQAIDLAIMRIEETCSTITGVFRERLGGIEQKDAVTNVQVGIKNSALITKQYYQLMDLMTREILIDIINLSKIVYKNGISGTLILGERLNKVFTSLPEYYCFTDHDIHVTDSSDIIKDQETIKQVSIEFVKGGVVDPEIILESITAKSLTKMKSDILSAINRKKQENNQLGQLSQQVEQLDQQLKETASVAEQLQKELEKLNAEKLKLEQEKLQHEKELEWYKAKTDSNYKNEMLEWNKKRVQLEGLQLLDNNKRNDEIRDK